MIWTTELINPSCGQHQCRAGDYEWKHNVKHWPTGYTTAELAARRASARSVAKLEPAGANRGERIVNHLWWLSAPTPINDPA